MGKTWIDISQRRNTNDQWLPQKYLILLFIRKIHIKTTMRYCLTSSRIAILKRQNVINAGKDVKKG